MAVHVTVKISGEKLAERLGSRQTDYSRVLRQIAAVQMTAMQNRLQDTYATGDEVYRTGNLMRSLQPNGLDPQGIWSIGPMSARVGSAVPYAAVQDKGGTIKPRDVKYLAVPLSRRVKVRAMWPRDFPRESLYFRKNFGGGRAVGYLFDATRGGLGLGDGPLFALVPSVTIPPKHMTRAAREATTRELGDIFHTWVESIKREAR